MQNKPNFRKAKMNVSNIITMNYKNFIHLAGYKNKPNSNPIKPNLRKAKMNVNLALTKVYRKKDDFLVRINKPNSNPISSKPKMSANVFVTKDYRKNDCLAAQKTNPIQTQSKPVLSAPVLSKVEGVEWANFFKDQNELKIACRKIWPHPF